MSDHASRLSGATVVVIGLGRSGVVAARLCQMHGARLVITDAAPEERLSPDALALVDGGARLFAGGHDGVPFAGADLVVISPGVPTFQALEDAERGGVPVIGEIELAYRFLPPKPIVAVGGSNGKTTTTTLVGELLAALGARPFVGGNIGTPPAEIVVQGTSDAFGAIVLELSSFQCERMPTFRPDRAALLNVTPNHLDRYADFDAYARAKGNMFANQDPRCAAVVPAGDDLCLREARRGRGATTTFGAERDAVAAFRFDRDAIHDVERGISYARADVRLAGDHNAANVCAALALVADRAGDPDVVRGVLERFEGLPHRVSRVRRLADVTYYDDSKATSVGAVVAAIRGLAEEKVVLIAGGRDKLGAYDPLVLALAALRRAAVLIGEGAARLDDAIGGTVPVERADTLEEAVRRAARLAQPGDAVLLSPACSSFDMFRDYKHRGEVFVAAVNALP